MSLASVFNESLRCRDIEVPEGDESMLERRLLAAHARGVAVFGVELAPESYAAYLGARAASASSLDSMALEDLFLAGACSSGNHAAAMVFQERFGPEITLALAQVPDAISISDEITQTILDQLLVPNEGGVRGIDAYRGRGALFSWLRIIAVRRALRELAKRNKEVALGDEQILASLGDAPELGYMKELYRSAFRAAFADALAELDYQARTMLRHHYVHGLSIDKLGTLYGIHRATAARRLAKSRESLLVGTRRRLLSNLRVTVEELDSIMRLIASNLDVSIGALMSSES